jgi:hypothetical protein
MLVLVGFNSYSKFESWIYFKVSILYKYVLFLSTTILSRFLLL